MPRIATGPCVKCGADDWRMRRKTVRRPNGTVYEITSRECRPCSTARRKAQRNAHKRAA